LRRRDENPRYFVATLAKALETLEALAQVNAEGDADIGLTELAKRVRLSVPTLFRILSTLQSRGYVQKNAQTSHYHLTLKTWEVGAAAVRRLTIREVARPWMEQLVKDTGETAHLAILQGPDIMVLDRLDSPHPVKVETYMGQRAPAHCSATGKVLLAFASNEARDEFFGYKLKRFTSKTLSDRAPLEREFALVRKQGYALIHEEWQEGVCSVAVPIWNYSGQVVAALSIAAPTERFAEERLRQQFIPALVRAGQGISQGMGFRTGSAQRETPHD
jgi:DNA-binding IclR family transcriptional regulator